MKKNASPGKESEAPSGSEKGVFWKRGLLRRVHFPEILESLEVLESQNFGSFPSLGSFTKRRGVTPPALVPVP